MGTSRGREAQLRDLTSREAVEVLAHQLEVERGERARVQTGELLMTAALLGAVFGSSYAVVRHFKMKDLKKISPAGGKKRRRRR
jgi:hypothetical protein